MASPTASRCCVLFGPGKAGPVLRALLMTTNNDLNSSLQLHVEYRPIADLAPRQQNPRTHSKKQIRQIADSIRRFGFINPLLVDGSGCLLAGHGRLAAAKLLNIATVPVIRLDRLNEAEKRAYVLADNKLAENAGWDRELLAIELQYLTSLEAEFDVSLTGFVMGEIDVLLAELAGAVAPGNEPSVPAADADGNPVSRRGDLWLIGHHRLLCGDATDYSSFEKLLGDQRAQMVFIDPPYNVRINGHVGGLGKVQHREFAMASGEMSPAEFTAFLRTVFSHLSSFTPSGSVHFVCMDWSHLGEVLEAGCSAYTELKNICVWNKTNAGMGALYRSKHELVLVYKSGTAAHINNVELGKNGRYRTNVWDYAGANVVGAARDADLAMHPTVKPVALVADAIKDVSNRNGIVLDCFAGSGTTLVAAHQAGRVGYGMELDPAYIDVAIGRMQKLGVEAVHAETGLKFSAMREQRDGGADVA